MCRAIAVVLLLACPGFASVAEPTPAAIDAAALANSPPRLVSGFSLTIVHGGRVVYAKGYGFRDAGTPDRFIANDSNYYGMPLSTGRRSRQRTDAQTIYALGSVSKQFTASAVLLLAEQHQLQLDDAVGTYVPEFADRGLTLRMLLNQRSGLADLNTLEFLQRVRPLAKRSDGSTDERRVVRELARLPRHFVAGTRFEYSNSNYYVLGTIVERVAHEPLGTFLAAHVFKPLKMTRTAYATTAASDNVAVGYRSDENHNVRRAFPWDLAWLGGAGAMTSTASDLARWNTGLVSGHVLTPASLALMWHGLDAGRGQGSYAMGWIEDALGSHRYLWHNGQVGGFHALNVIFPDDGLAFTILTNNQDARPEYILPGLAALYFPVNGLDRILPHSAVILIEASLAVALGALGIGVVAIVTFKRLIAVGVIAAILALVLGFFMPSVVGYAWGGLAALIPVVGYVLAVRYFKRPARTQP